jgi:outer membrane protein OmpA-like peptidoglycan-associated protein
MRQTSLFFLGTVLVSGCAADIPQHQRAGVDTAANKPVTVHGITQEAANGKARFVWCGECPRLTPKVADRPGWAAKDVPSGKANAANRRQFIAVIHFDFDSAAIRPDEAIKHVGLLKSIGRNATVVLRGYTDAAGSMAYNQHLAWRRTQAVRRWLSTHMKQQVRYDIRAFGKCCYARQPGLSPENRRVEIYLKEEDER